MKHLYRLLKNVFKYNLDSALLSFAIPTILSCIYSAEVENPSIAVFGAVGAIVGSLGTHLYLEHKRFKKYGY